MRVKVRGIAPGNDDDDNDYVGEGRRTGDATRRKKDERAGCMLPSPRREGMLRVSEFNEPPRSPQPRATFTPRRLLSLTFFLSLSFYAFSKKWKELFTKFERNSPIVLNF